MSNQWFREYFIILVDRYNSSQGRLLQLVIADIEKFMELLAKNNLKIEDIL